MVSVEELQRLDLFQPLPLTTLQSLAKWSEQVVFRQGDRIIRQGAAGDYFYVILSGHVAVYRELETGERIHLNELAPGEFFGEVALLTGEPRNATVESLTPCEVIRINANVFGRLRKAYPEWVDILDNTARLRSQFSRYFPEREPDEVGIVFALRHPYALIESLLPPAIVAFLLIALFAFLASSARLPMTYLWGILAASAIGLLLWVLWLYFDWANDYLIVTNKRVMHIEQVLLYSMRRSTAFVEQVRTVTTDTPTPLARLFGYKDIIIQTGSTIETIRFSSVGDAEKISREIMQARDRARDRRDVEGQQDINRHLRCRIEPRDDQDASSASTAPQPVPATVPREAGPGPFRRLLSYFIPQIVVRSGDRVTWRRHWYILLRTTFLSGLAFLVLNIAIVWLFLNGLLFAGSRQIFLWLSLTVIYLISLGWLIWRYEDWYNDYYIMTGSQIIDRNSLPFGFQERREVVTFDSVQNVRADVPKWTYKLLNMGHVFIDTIGGTKSTQFDSVLGPIAIQQEIFSRLEMHQELQRHERMQERGNELAEWFAAYHAIMQNDGPESQSPPSSTDVSAKRQP